MDLSNPARAVMPSVHGAVLRALAHTDRPISGRALAELVGDQAGYRRVSQVLGQLVEAGVVLRESQPPAYLYRLNREHVAAEAIAILADLRARLMHRISNTVNSWKVQPVALWLFGSGARGDGNIDSDLDILVVRPDTVGDADPGWRHQLENLAANATAWSGNDCQLLEYSQRELAALVTRGERLVTELRAEAIVLAGKSPQEILRKKRDPR